MSGFYVVMVLALIEKFGSIYRVQDYEAYE